MSKEFTHYYAVALVTFGLIEFVAHFEDGALPIYIALSVALIARLMAKLNEVDAE